jgi:hypothetical protein
MYAVKIDNHSARLLQYILVNPISIAATVRSDNRKEYGPIAKVYDITQTYSNDSLPFKALHTMIH